MHLGKHQKEIIAAMRAGATLHCDGGMWGWTKEGVDAGRCVASSCVALLRRGLIYERERQPGRGAYGSERVVYALTERAGEV